MLTDQRLSHVIINDTATIQYSYLLFVNCHFSLHSLIHVLCFFFFFQICEGLIRCCQTFMQIFSGQEGCSVILTAPARALAMSHVLSQFSFKVAEYHGKI